MSSDWNYVAHTFCHMYTVNMDLAFVWDDEKERENISKHGVDFQEASTVFTSAPLAIFYDPDHSDAEHRYIAVGFSDRNRVLLVVHCENRVGTEIRIISAWRATKKERAQAFKQGGI